MKSKNTIINIQRLLAHQYMGMEVPSLLRFYWKNWSIEILWSQKGTGSSLKNEISLLWYYVALFGVSKMGSNFKPPPPPFTWKSRVAGASQEKSDEIHFQCVLTFLVNLRCNNSFDKEGCGISIFLPHTVYTELLCICLKLSMEF